MTTQEKVDFVFSSTSLFLSIQFSSLHSCTGSLAQPMNKVKWLPTKISGHPAVPLLGIYIQKNSSTQKFEHKYSQQHIHRTKSWNNWLSIQEWINYHLSMKWNDICHKKLVLGHAVTWRNLENVLKERSRSQKTTQYTISFICTFQNGQIHRHRKQTSSF